MKLLGSPFVPNGPKKLFECVDMEEDGGFAFGPEPAAEKLAEALASKPCWRFLGIMMSMLCGPDTSTDAGIGGEGDCAYQLRRESREDLGIMQLPFEVNATPARLRCGLR